MDAFLDSRRLSSSVMGSFKLQPGSSVTTQCRLKIKLSTSGCEKENRDRANHGIYSAQPNHESSLVTSNPRHDDEFRILNRYRRMACRRFRQNNKGIESVIKALLAYTPTTDRDIHAIGVYKVGSFHSLLGTSEFVPYYLVMILKCTLN